MGAFDGSILIGSVRTSRADVVAVAFKEATYFWICVEFAALIKEDIFVRTMWGVGFKKVLEPVNWRCF